MTFRNRCCKFTWLTVAWLFAVVLCPSSPAADEVVVIVNKGVATASMEKEALRDIFLGNTSVWPDDKKVNFAVLGESETHKTFVRVITRKTESQFQAWWKRKLFTGTGKVPPKFKTDQEMIDYVAKTDGGLGYVSPSAAIGERVKILTVTDK